MARSIRPACVLMLLAATSACEVVDRVRNRGEPAETADATATAGGLTLGLQIPGMLQPGQEGTVRLSLTNRGDSVPEDIRIDLIVPGWMELAPPRPGDREVTMSADAETGTRLSYRMDDPPLQPGETQLVEQRIRIPMENQVQNRGRPWARVIRARLIGANGESLTEVQSEVALDTAFMGDSLFASNDSAAMRDQLGPARLGMTAAEIRQAAPGARDTSWSQEGMTQRGIVLPIGNGGGALTVLSGDTVSRIEVRDTVLRTREGIGVGSTLDELRSAYGRTCAAAGEGIIVVWFPSAPGISFALDTPFSSVQSAIAEPDRIPGTSRVTRWWLRHGLDQCSVSGG